jgi:hypothetical protein
MLDASDRQIDCGGPARPYSKPVPIPYVSGRCKARPRADGPVARGRERQVRGAEALSDL